MTFRIPRPAAVGALTVAAALAAACGTTAGLTGASPSQAIATALQAAQTAPLKASFTASLSLDTANVQGLPASIQSQLAKLGGGASVTGTLVQESNSRRELEATLQGHTYDLVQYDGHGYFRKDGGAWAEISPALPSTPAASGSEVSTVVGDLGFTDQGPATVGGASAEHYHAAVTTATLTKLIEDLAPVMSSAAPGGSSSSLAAGLALLSSYITLSNGTADVWLSTAGGSLAKTSLSGTLTVDLGSIASALAGLGGSGAMAGPMPSGTLGVSLSLSGEVSQYGGSVTVTKPVASRTMPMPVPGIPGLSSFA